MYDDGPGSPNVDCQGGNTSGCWGHRDDILAPFTCSPCVMGSAVSVDRLRGRAVLGRADGGHDGHPCSLVLLFRRLVAEVGLDGGRHDGDRVQGLLAR